MYTLIQNTSSLTLASMCYTSHTSTEPILSIITYKTSDGKLCPTHLLKGSISGKNTLYTARQPIQRDTLTTGRKTTSKQRATDHIYIQNASHSCDTTTHHVLISAARNTSRPISRCRLNLFTNETQINNSSPTSFIEFGIQAG